MEFPFIYISSMTRTGSTLVAETLTQLPYAFIFREPHLGKNDFQIRPDDVERLSEYGVDMERFLRYRLMLAFLQRRLRRLGWRQDYMVRAMKYDLLPQMPDGLEQIGVKEVRNRGWRNYLRHFPHMLVVLTGRDPRDIYLSVYHRWARGVLPKRKPVTPHAVAEELSGEFALQREIASVTEHRQVRYEDLCTDPTLIDEIKSFVRSPIPTIGTVGQFIGRHPERADESQLHGHRITTQRVRRWTGEPDEELVAQAHQVFDLMPEYCAYWGYSR